MAAKDPITCHVLDTLTGRPAPNIEVSLSCLSHDSAIQLFEATTNSDGRITNWSSKGHAARVAEVLDGLKADSGPSTWKLTFATGKYYGEGNTFWPQVDLTFFVKAEEARVERENADSDKATFQLLKVHLGRGMDTGPLSNDGIAL